MKSLLILMLSIPLLICCGESTSSNKSEDENLAKEGSNWLSDLKELKNKALDKSQKLSDKLQEKWNNIEINGFSVDDDIKMGQQLYDEIHSSAEFKVVSKEKNQKLYDYLENIKNTILSNGDFRYKDKFQWKITVLIDDKTINAFCAPGGYIFVYTGILRYLDNEAELAGVLAHEMGHAERRHGTRQMTKTYGIQMVLDFLLQGSDSESFKQVIGGLLTLRYSRSYEREADECSVRYLCATSYQSDGAAGFFEKIRDENGQKGDELLSTHPDPEERITNFHLFKKKFNCRGKQNFVERYRVIKKLSIK